MRKHILAERGQNELPQDKRTACRQRKLMLEWQRSADKQIRYEISYALTGGEEQDHVTGKSRRH